MKIKALSVVGGLVAVVLLAVVFINFSSEKKNQKLTPQSISELAGETTFSSPNVENQLRDIFSALDSMDLNELTEVVHLISLDNWDRQSSDLRMSILMASAQKVSEKLISKYRNTLDVVAAETEVVKIFGSHPFLLRVVADEAVASAEATKETADQKAGEEKTKLLLEAANLYMFAATCSAVQSTPHRPQPEKSKRLPLKTTVYAMMLRARPVRALILFNL